MGCLSIVHPIKQGVISSQWTNKIIVEFWAGSNWWVAACPWQVDRFIPAISLSANQTWVGYDRGRILSF